MSFSRTLLLILCTGCLCLCAAAEELSKQNLIDLQKSGVGASVIIQQIQNDGINFDMNAETTLQLRKLGFPDSILQALLKAAANHKQASQPQVRALYDQGKYSELIVELRKALAGKPNDLRSRTILVLTLLKMNDKPSAQAELEKLKLSANASPYVSKIEDVMKALESNKRAKNNLVNALLQLKAAEAETAIDSLTASQSQKELLRVYLDTFQGKFDGARERLEHVAVSSSVEQQRLAEVRTKIDERAGVYRELMSRAEFYTHSPLVPSECAALWIDKTFPDLRQLSFKEYGDVVTKLVELAPLDPKVLDLAFHAEMIFGTYDQVQTVGDRILAAKGTIRIPFYSSNSYFNLVVDRARGRLFTESDPHPFIARYAGPRGKKGLSYDSNYNGYNADLVSFDLAFGEITSISQRAEPSKGSGGTFLEREPVAVGLTPRGVAPSYALMHMLICLAGEHAERTATNNLGKYLVHVVNNPGLRASLTDPSKESKAGIFDRFFDQLTPVLLASQSTGSQAGLAGLNAQVLGTQLEQDQARKDQASARVQAQRVAWLSNMVEDQFAFGDSEVFRPLEELLPST